MSRGHHVLFEKSPWLSGKKDDPRKRLRQMPGLVVPIVQPFHDELHKEVKAVTYPNYGLGQAILSIYRDNPDDHMRSIDNLVEAIQQAIEQPRVRTLEYQTGDLMISQIYAQIPHIRAGRVEEVGGYTGNGE
jgi:hypothetical protein